MSYNIIIYTHILYASFLHQGIFCSVGKCIMYIEEYDVHILFTYVYLYICIATLCYILPTYVMHVLYMLPTICNVLYSHVILYINNIIY